MTSGTVDITPTERLPLAGHSGRARVATGVHSPLEANVLCFRRGEHRFLVVSVDTLYIGRELRDRLRSSAGLSEEALFIGASHTHGAPSLDPSKPGLGRTAPAYLNETVERISRLLEQVQNESGETASASARKVSVALSVNRRRMGWGWKPGHLPHRAMQFRPNGAGPRDPWIRVLRFNGKDGNPVAALWSFGCHPVAVPDPTLVNAGFPGEVRRRIREAVGSELPVLFFQGFSGDVRPDLALSPRTLKERLTALTRGPSFGVPSEEEYRGWCDTLSSSVVGAMQKTDVPDEALAPLAKRVRIPLNDICAFAGEPQQLSVHRLNVSPSIGLLGFSAEPVAQYATWIAALQPTRFILPVGCIDSVFGYLPTDEQIQEGGYEGGGFWGTWQQTGTFRTDVESVALRAAASAMADD